MGISRSNSRHGKCPESTQLYCQKGLPPVPTTPSACIDHTAVATDKSTPTPSEAFTKPYQHRCSDNQIEAASATLNTTGIHRHPIGVASELPCHCSRTTVRAVTERLICKRHNPSPRISNARQRSRTDVTKLSQDLRSLHPENF
jgi:hypothetical protein